MPKFTGMAPKWICFALCWFCLQSALSQPDSLVLKRRRIALLSGSSALAAGSLVYLNQAWYSQYNTGRFHFFNDNAEWLQMDKAGHAFTTYQTARLMMGAMEQAGYTRRQQLLFGGLAAYSYMTVIEVFDGFSAGWGFSWGDQLANTLGTSLAVAQAAAWREQRIQIKYSYANSGLAGYNPDLLGNNFYTRILKDYNAQTIWLSVNPSSFLSEGSRFPRWLNVAFGYSAYGMLGGYANTFVVQDAQGNVLKWERERRLYLSLDIDLTRIKTRSRLLKTVFSVINILKFPAPALGFSREGLRFHALYY